MIVSNKLDKPFGPTASVSGVILFVAGLIILFYSLTGLILILPGALLGFTYTSAVIDFNKKRVKFTNNLFGIIKSGQWRNLTPGMTLGIRKSNRVWKTYSRSNKTLELDESDYRLILYDHKGNEIMPLKKYRNPDSAKPEMADFGQRLGLQVKG
jgi:hypothetical protein